ncbi:MAG: hypothetical protein ACOYOV_15200 [Bacteroidales bacterium]
MTSAYSSSDDLKSSEEESKTKEHPENPLKRVGKNNKQHKVMKTKQLILLVAFLGMFIQGNAQTTTSPTLEQTMSFISLKCMDIRWALTSGNIDPDISWSYRCAMRPNDKIYLNGKTLYAVRDSKNNNNTNFHDELIISLNLVEGISLVDYDNCKYIRIYSSKPFFELNKSMDMKSNDMDLPLLDNKNIYIGCINDEDAPKIYKAFKHLIDLLGVKLNDDMF